MMDGNIMRIMQINIFGNLSTGRIATDLYRSLINNGAECLVAFARGSVPEDVKHIKIGSKSDVILHGIMTRITDRAGFYSSKATKELIHNIDEYKPDLIHLHNIHGYYLNIKLLFDYLRKTQIPVVWTLHDCWSYTGHCCYYSMSNCNKWENGCYECPEKKSYPSSCFLDNSKRNYKQKKDLFNGINMTLVPVSYWLGNEVKKSFLKHYPVEVIQNGIDLNVFKPTTSDFRKNNNIVDKKIVLAVSSSWWGERKGFKDLIKLSNMLDDSYKLVVVGVTDKEKRKLPNHVLGIKRTDSVEELASIYSAADVFVNVSVEETFGLPTVEAMACGTPVIVYDATAIPEVVTPDTGYVVKPHDLKAVVDGIKRCGDFNTDKIISNAHKYSKNLMMQHYLEVYKKMLE